jgi:hypothetical protein
MSRRDVSRLRAIAIAAIFNLSASACFAKDALAFSLVRLLSLSLSQPVGKCIQDFLMLIVKQSIVTLHSEMC